MYDLFEHSQQGCSFCTLEFVAQVAERKAVGRPSPNCNLLDDTTRKQLDGTIHLDRPRVVVLGSGWASMSFIKALPVDIK